MAVTGNNAALGRILYIEDVRVFECLCFATYSGHLNKSI
jgi:hypothetical protein